MELGCGEKELKGAMLFEKSLRLSGLKADFQSSHEAPRS
jgi:hypothetical protein